MLYMVAEEELARQWLSFSMTKADCAIQEAGLIDYKLRQGNAEILECQRNSILQQF